MKGKGGLSHSRALSYYSDRLAAERLKRCYEIAPPRVRRYLRAEVDFALGSVREGDLLLDLGCGYGRTIQDFAHKAGFVVGIDTSSSSLALGRTCLTRVKNCLLLEMDAANLAFLDDSFDVVICIQNGISAFHRDPERLFRESIRAAKPGGKILFSTYARRFWPHRLEWFRRQAEEGLVGEIDEKRTGDGVIVCRDGFRATTFSSDQFRALALNFPVAVEIVEVDESSLFCVMTKDERF